MPRTPVWQWGALFNFAGRGIVHQEIFALILVSAQNPTLFEAIAAYLFLSGTAALRPSESDVPLNALYFETDTEELFQNISGTWTQIASVGGGGGGATLAAGTLAGRGSSSGSGVYEEITLDSSLDLTGTVLSVAGGVGNPGLQLIERKLLTASATSVTFSSLDGNAEGVYRLVTRILNRSGSTASYTLRPNGATTNQNSSRGYSNNGSGGNDTTTTLRFAECENNMDIVSQTDFFARCDPDSIATKRWYTGHYTAFSAGVIVAMVGGRWNETSTNMTTLEVVSSVSNGLGEGSEITLYKYAE